MTATPNIGYAFVQWSDGNTENPRTITVTEDITYTATFALAQHTLTLVAEHGTISGAESGTQYDYGTICTLTATPDEHYVFTGWSDGVMDNPRTITVMEDMTYTAEFAPIMFTITATANDAAYGTVMGGGEYFAGSTAVLTAVAAEGYAFVKWTAGDGSEYEEATLTFTVTADAEYMAIFQVESFATALPDTRDSMLDTRKVLEDGQVIIIRDGARYNVLGVKVK